MWKSIAIGLVLGLVSALVVLPHWSKRDSEREILEMQQAGILPWGSDAAAALAKCCAYDASLGSASDPYFLPDACSKDTGVSLNGNLLSVIVDGAVVHTVKIPRPEPCEEK